MKNIFEFFTLRRTMKWYRKVLVDLLLNVGVVNAACLFNLTTKSTMSITYFRSSLVESLIKKTVIPIFPSAENHKLQKCKRSRCCVCYKKNERRKGEKICTSILY